MALREKCGFYEARFVRLCGYAEWPRRSRRIDHTFLMIRTASSAHEGAKGYDRFAYGLLLQDG